MGKVMDKELILIKNINNTWDFVFDIAKTINNPLNTNEDCINFLLNEFSFLKLNDILIDNEEIYILLEEPLPCANCGN